jgi:hypothetical protein
VKEVQTELTRLGCYNASINGKFDEATKKSLALYHTKKGSFEDGDRLTDGLLSELKQQNLGLCPTEPPSAPVVATPGNGAPTSTPAPPKQKSEQAKKEKPSTKHKVQSAAHEEQLAPRLHQRPHPSFTSERPKTVTPARPKTVIAHAPRMPQSPAAEAGPASHVPQIHGVGF